MAAPSVNALRKQRPGTKKSISMRMPVGASHVNVIVDRAGIIMQASAATDARFYSDLSVPPVPSLNGGYGSTDALEQARAKIPLLNMESQDTAFQYIGPAAVYWQKPDPRVLDEDPVAGGLDEMLGTVTHSRAIVAGATSTQSHIPSQTTALTLPLPTGIVTSADPAQLGAGTHWPANWRERDEYAKIAARMLARETRVIGFVDRVDTDESQNGRTVAQQTGIVSKVNTTGRITPFGTRHYPTFMTAGELRTTLIPELKPNPVLVWVPYTAYEWDLGNLKSMAVVIARILTKYTKTGARISNHRDLAAAPAAAAPAAAVQALENAVAPPDLWFAQQIDRAVFYLMRSVLEVFHPSAGNAIQTKHVMNLLTEYQTALRDPQANGLLRQLKGWMGLIMAVRDAINIVDPNMVLINEETLDTKAEGSYRIATC